MTDPRPTPRPARIPLRFCACCQQTYGSEVQCPRCKAARVAILEPSVVAAINGAVAWIGVERTA